MNQNVQTRSVSLKTQRQIDFVAENIAVISIPPAEVPMLYGKQTYLRFNILINGASLLVIMAVFYYALFLMIVGSKNVEG